MDLTCDGRNWVQFHESYAIGIEPIYASGNYFASFVAGSFQAEKRLTLIR